MSHPLKTAFAVAVAVGALSAPAFAAAATHTAPNFTGPLVTPAVNTLPEGLINIEPYLVHTNTRGSYDNAGYRHGRDATLRQWQIAVPMTYGLTNSLSVQLTLSAARTSGAGLHSDGLRIGDTAVRLQQRLKAPEADGTGLVLGIAAAQRVPTGKYEQLGANPLNAMGNGTARTVLSVGAQQLHWLSNDHALRWRSQLAWSPSPGQIGVRGSSVYGTDRGFRGAARIGQNWNATFAAEYVLDARWVLVGEAIWNRSGTVTVTGRMPYATRAHSNYRRRLAPGQDFSLAPAVEYHFNPAVGLIAGVQFTVAGRNSSDYVAPQVALNMVF